MELKAAPNCCEEASMLSHQFYIPCNAPASYIVAFLDAKGEVREGPYRMCEPCMDHNTRNRRATLMGPHVPR